MGTCRVRQRDAADGCQAPSGLWASPNLSKAFRGGGENSKTCFKGGRASHLTGASGGQEPVLNSAQTERNSSEHSASPRAPLKLSNCHLGIQAMQEQRPGRSSRRPFPPALQHKMPRICKWTQRPLGAPSFFPFLSFLRGGKYLWFASAAEWFALR